ncbi:MAG: polymer-forming cytoskeletal protein [Burkholderiaceae bacterium]|nr:polymer-forming cytoskeletal protein [Burkholderiaceae bacterium]
MMQTKSKRSTGEDHTPQVLAPAQARERAQAQAQAQANAPAARPSWLSKWLAARRPSADRDAAAAGRVLRSLVGHKLAIHGDMIVDSHGLRIDGEVFGNVTSDNGLVMIGEGGSVMGTIRAAHIIVAGKVNGNLIAQDRLECNATCKVYGHVRAKGFVIHAGALVQGTMSAVQDGADLPLPQAPANEASHGNTNHTDDTHAAPLANDVRQEPMRARAAG